MAKKISKIILITFISIFLIGASFVGVIYFHQDKITDLVIKKLNESQEGYLTVDHVTIAPFKNFPYVSVEFDTLKLYQTKDTQKPPVYDFNVGYIGFDIYDLLQKNYAIKKLVLRNGYIDFVKFEDGSSNFLLSDTTEDEDEGELSIDLQEIVIENVTFKKSDYSLDQFTEVLLKDIKTKLSYRKNFIDIHIDGISDIIEFKSNGETFLSNKHIEVSTDIHYDSKRDLIKVDSSQFKLEKALFDFEGQVSDISDSLIFDLDIKGNKSNFDLLLAFAPQEYSEKLKKYKNEGEIYFIGKIAGPSNYSLTPHVRLDFGCKNAQFKNPQEDKGFRDLNFQGFFTNGSDRSLETSELSIRNLSVIPENSTFKGNFRMKNFLSPLFFIDLHSSIDLAVVQEFYPIEGIEKLSGRIDIDMTLDELIDPDSSIVILSKLKDGTDSRVIFKDIHIKHQAYPHSIKNIDGEIDITDDKFIIAHFKANINQSNLSLKGEIMNLLALAHKTPAPFTFNLEAKSDLLDLKELLSYDSTLSGWNDKIKNLVFKASFKSRTEELIGKEGLPNLWLSLDKLEFNTEKYPFPVSKCNGLVTLKDNFLDLDKVNLKVGDNDLYIHGDIRNFDSYVSNDNKEIAYDLEIKSKHLNLKELLVYDGKSLTSEEIQEELLTNLILIGKGKFKKKLDEDTGMEGNFSITHFNLKLNDYPEIKQAKGNIALKKDGSISVSGLEAIMGKSDFSLNIDMANYLDEKNKNRPIKGSFSSHNLDLDDLFHYSSKNDQVDHDSVFNIFALPFPDLELLVKIDNFKHHKYIINDINGKLRSNKDHYIYVDNLAFRAAEGNANINGYFNGSDKNHIYFSSTVNIDNMNMDKIFYKFDNFGQDYMVNNNIHGILSANIKSKVLMHPDLVVDLSKTDATADVTIKDGRLVNFAPLHAMSEYFNDKNLDNVRFGEMSNTFVIKEGFISFPAMKLSSTLGYFHISGRQDFDMNMDYEVKVPLSLIRQAGWSMAKSKLKKNKIEDEDLANKEEDIVDSQTGLIKKYITFSVKGNSDDFSVKMGKNKK